MQRIIDLTPPIYEGMMFKHPYHPRGPFRLINEDDDAVSWEVNLQRRRAKRHLVHGGLPEEAAEMLHGMSEQVIVPLHMGAHIDAAKHFDVRAEQDAASIPLERCMGDGILLDLREVCGSRPSYPVSIADLEAAEKEAGSSVSQGDIVILHTGHAARYGYGPNMDRVKWADWYPGLGEETAGWFIDRDVKLVGIDTPNVDYDLVCTSHYSFLLRGMIGKPPIQIVENLVNLELIPRPRFTFIALPLPFVGGSGSPVRAVALV